MSQVSRAAALLAGALLLSGLLAASAPATNKYRHVRGLGPAKRVASGLFKVKLKDGTTLTTHGVDLELPEDHGVSMEPGDPERPPVCATDYFQHVLYGYPADSSSRLSTVLPAIRSAIRRMNAVLNEESVASAGVNADYKVACDATGEIKVGSFKSSQTSASTTFSGVVSAAKAAGFAAGNVDYTIFFDSSAPAACGTGSYAKDERLTADNANNTGLDYAVAYSDCWNGRTPMHENGHNQGAVQYGAPWSTGSGGHCNDGHDVMCYSDGGDRDVGMSILCSTAIHFDCNNDTYFNPAPAAGSYLAGRWNLGSRLNRFIAFGAAAGTTTPEPTPEPTPAPTQQPAAACADGVDNDGDGKIDHPADRGCKSTSDGDERNGRQ